MPILSIISQPVTNGIKAAYRPVVIRVSATRTDGAARPPVVYCDIYFNNLFYKTISKTQYTLLNAGDSEWEFDIQDAAQEYLRKYLGGNGASTFLDASPIIARTLCKFRSSGFDADGFILSEDIAPVQGTGGTDPVPGSGTNSAEFYVVNATLQHEDNQELSLHLNSLKKRTWIAADFPLSHRLDHYKICVNDSDFFPILHNDIHESTYGINLSCIVLNYKYKGQSSFSQLTNCGPQSCPLISGVEFVVVDNLDDTQTVTITFDAIASPAATLDVQYRPANTTGAWTSNSGSIISPREVTMATGLYDFRFVTSGDCVDRTSAVYEDIGITVCQPVAIVGSIDLPDAKAGEAYSYSIELSGTTPHTISDVVKPAWMSIIVSGSFINFIGTPAESDVADDVPVSFTIENCGGDGSVPVAQVIDVTGGDGLVNVSNNSPGAIVSDLRINGFSIQHLSGSDFPVHASESGLFFNNYDYGTFAVTVTIGGSSAGWGVVRFTDSAGTTHDLPNTGAGNYIFTGCVLNAAASSFTFII